MSASGFLAMIGGTTAVAFAAGVETAVLLQGVDVPEPYRLIVLTTLAVFLAIIGGFSLLKRFRLVGAPHSDFGAQLAEALTTQAGWRGEVTAILASMMGSTASLPALSQALSTVAGEAKLQTAQLQELRNAILLDNSKTRHEVLAPMKAVVDATYREIDENVGPRIEKIRDYVIREETRP